MRVLLTVAAAASLALAAPGQAQVCRGHRGWAALGYRQGIAMRWFQEHGRTVGPDVAEKACNNNAECRDHLGRTAVYGVGRLVEPFGVWHRSAEAASWHPPRAGVRVGLKETDR